VAGGRPPVETASPAGLTRPDSRSCSTRAPIVDRAWPVIWASSARVCGLPSLSSPKVPLRSPEFCMFHDTGQVKHADRAPRRIRAPRPVLCVAGRVTVRGRARSPCGPSAGRRAPTRRPRRRPDDEGLPVCCAHRGPAFDVPPMGGLAAARASRRGVRQPSAQPRTVRPRVGGRSLGPHGRVGTALSVGVGPVVVTTGPRAVCPSAARHVTFVSRTAEDPCSVATSSATFSTGHRRLLVSRGARRGLGWVKDHGLALDVGGSRGPGPWLLS